MKTAVKMSVAVATFFVVAFAMQADEDHIRWVKNGAPTETYVTGGPWTLEQSGAANGLKSSGYCDLNGIQIGNPGTQQMQPYYFPVINRHGEHLQGYFDWRPKDIDKEKENIADRNILCVKSPALVGALRVSGDVNHSRNSVFDERL